jgi:Protein of unknown function (DUF1572)
MATCCDSAPTRKTPPDMAPAPTLAADIATLLVRELRGFQRELELFADDGSIWRTVPGITNPAGNLALHVSGNLQHYVGAVLGGTSYVRRRDVEFSTRSGTRSDLIAELESAIRAVESVAPRLTEETLQRMYPAAEVDGRRIRTGRFLTHLCTHAAYHLAQAGSLRRVLSGDCRGSGAIPLSALAE